MKLRSSFCGKRQVDILVLRFMKPLEFLAFYDREKAFLVEVDGSFLMSLKNDGYLGNGYDLSFCPLRSSYKRQDTRLPLFWYIFLLTNVPSRESFEFYLVRIYCIKYQVPSLFAFFNWKRALVLSSRDYETCCTMLFGAKIKKKKMFLFLLWFIRNLEILQCNLMERMMFSNVTPIFSFHELCCLRIFLQSLFSKGSPKYYTWYCSFDFY